MLAVLKTFPESVLCSFTSLSLLEATPPLPSLYGGGLGTSVDTVPVWRAAWLGGLCFPPALENICTYSLTSGRLGQWLDSGEEGALSAAWLLLYQTCPESLNSGTSVEISLWGD